MQNILQSIMPNVMDITDRVIESSWETIYMTVVSALFAGILGVIFGILLVTTQKGGILENTTFYSVLEKIINLFRSIPFIILMTLLVPVTRVVVGTTIGTTAAIIPLIVGTVPFFSKQVENALLEVDPGIVEAAESMGSSPMEIIWSVYLKEGLPSLIRVSSVTLINLIGLTTMAGVIGGGGLGNLAITRGYNRFQTDVTIVTTLLIMVLVFISQAIGNYLVKRTKH